MACLSGVFDWNGGARPNKLGDDVITLGMASGLGNNCAFEVGSTCYTAPFTPTPMTLAECQAAVAEGKLGIKWCHWANEYWAGAVKQCKGVSKMPTMAQLSELVSQLYIGNPSIRANENIPTGGLQFDSNSETAKAFGLTLTLPFYIWSGEEHGSYNAYYRGFYSTATYLLDGARTNRNIVAVCIND